MGAWIEIAIEEGKKRPEMSLPIWGRGLKCENDIDLDNRQIVAPYMGAWIEI